MGPQAVESLLFDLDDTLYRDTRIAGLMKDNITNYMREHLNVTEEYIQAKSKSFYMDYGTTLAGLRSQGYQIDYEDWHKHVHGCLPYREILKPDPELQRIIQSLPQTKYIFTNADIKHAETVLGILGIRDLFEEIICFESIMREAEVLGIAHPERPVICKPAEEAFQLALKFANFKPETTVFLDDSQRNVESATRMGIRSVLVGTKTEKIDAIATVESLHELPKVLPQLWQKLTPIEDLDLQTVRRVGAEIKVSAN